ncbi:H(+)/Cl(-) exchange transporter 7 [Lamellibrachia satsuma]|nr:H(+)/Cl(-) exchange transporter 7 [Lamellibrachia satsuma]
MVATFTVNVLLSALHGHPADLSNPGLISFGKFQNSSYQVIEIPIFLLMAVFGGLLGALFNQLNRKLTVFRKKYITSKWAKVAEAVVVAATSAVIGFILIYTVDDCVPTPEKGDFEGHTQAGCAEGEHNVMSSLFFKTPEQCLIAVLHSKPGSFTVVSLSLFAFLYFMLGCWTYGLSVSSGVFIPALLTGAAWGRLVGMAVMYIFPQMGYDYGAHSKMTQQGNDIGKYALMGAASQLGGIVRMTISLTVILIECTGDITFGLPMVMVLITAKWVGDFFNTGLYDLHIRMMGIPLLPWEPPELSYDITAKQVMNTPALTLQLRDTVQNVYNLLVNTPQLHSGFPVVSISDIPPEEGQYGRCKGLILRSQLCFLLNNKIFLRDISHGSNEAPLKLKDFRDVYRQHISCLDVKLTEEEKKMYIDLEPFMNPAPYTVPLNASLPRMFRLFRGLGLRHLIIVNDSNQVVGMATRKDLAKYRLKARIGAVKMQELHIHREN